MPTAEELEAAAVALAEYTSQLVARDRATPIGPAIQLARTLRGWATSCRSVAVSPPTLPPPDAEPLHEYAHRTGLNPRTARARAARGAIPGGRKFGGRWYVVPEVFTTPPGPLSPLHHDDRRSDDT